MMVSTWWCPLSKSPNPVSTKCTNLPKSSLEPEFFGKNGTFLKKIHKNGKKFYAQNDANDVSTILNVRVTIQASILIFHNIKINI